MVNRSSKVFRKYKRFESSGTAISIPFIVVTEAPSQMIIRAENWFLRGFVVGNEDLQISQLQFANDTVIFCDVEVRQLRALRCVPRCFKVVSGLKMNLSKVPNVSNFQLGKRQT